MRCANYIICVDSFLLEGVDVFDTRTGIKKHDRFVVVDGAVGDEFSECGQTGGSLRSGENPGRTTDLADGVDEFIIRNRNGGSARRSDSIEDQKIANSF